MTTSSKNLVLAGFAVFLVFAFVFRVIGQTPLAVSAKYWFICGAIIQWLCSMPMDRTARSLHRYMDAMGKPHPKSRDAILALAEANPHLIPADLLEKYNLWQTVSIFLGGALLCAIVLMAISFLKFV